LHPDFLQLHPFRAIFEASFTASLCYLDSVKIDKNQLPGIGAEYY